MSHTIPGKGPLVAPAPAPGPAAVPTGVRRRPSGEPPPLPRAASVSTRLCLGAGAGLVALWAALGIGPLTELVTTVDAVVVRAVAGIRTAWLTRGAEAVQGLGSVWTLRLLVWPTLAVLVAFRRFARLGAYLLVVLGTTAAGAGMAGQLGRMRPAGIAILGRWDGASFPSLPVAAFGVALVGGLYALLPAGPRRNRAAVLSAVPLMALVAARLYLGVEHPTDLLAGIVLGVALPVAVFRLLVPDDTFPVSYRRGTRAHLDVTGARGAALASALERQLGLDVVSVEPFALSNSAGSTPLRITVRRRSGGGEHHVFGKLYATSHLRSDRWYKLARTVLYGRLEDERPFNTVRRLVEYEDHMLRIMRDAGLPAPAPLGFVEITPEREYLIVTEFFDGAGRIGEDPVDEAVIDDALAVVAGLWDAGLAHRDVKPGNLLVRDGRVLLIDVAFAAVRPSPWREAVDLANMMLTLALYSSPEQVYERALRRFSADEISEAFAATRSVTVPSQLRALLRADGRHLTTRFRALAPPRHPVAVQRWSVRRVGLTLAVVAGAAAAASVLADNLQLTSVPAGAAPGCRADEHLALVAQSVPGAAYVPCVDTLPAGWAFESLEVRSGSTTLVLRSDRSTAPVQVRLQAGCRVDGATAVASRAEGVRSYQFVRSISPNYAARRLDVFGGGCVTYDYDFARGAHIALADELSSAVGLYPRRQLRTELRRDVGVSLDP
jgi:tRNA A-37 threonylcarbamoyl transferase component Bud32/membrane-associated phospholipid phosphatase